MTKSELIERLASQQPHIPAKAVEDAVKEMLEHMASTLAQGERIEIRGFGSFSLHYRAPRTGRNAIAPIFTATEFSQPVKLGSKESTCGCFFCACHFNSEDAPHFSFHFLQGDKNITARAVKHAFVI